MTVHVVTGGTGFLGRHVLPLLLARTDVEAVHVLVRESSVARLEAMAAGWDGGEKVHPLVGDLTAPGLGLGRRGPRAADHVIHLGAVYDMTASEEVSRAANVEGTRSVIALATRLGATLHHVSSVAVAGEHRGRYTESDFDRGQSFGSPYHQTKFEAEQLVRETCTGPWRVYRPSVVVGDSVTGEMDKVDGPYYFFGALRRLGELAPGMAAVPVAVPDVGSTNIVPVDYVAQALVHLVHRAEGDGKAFHLVHPRPQSVREVYGAFAAAAGAPTPVLTVPAPWLVPFGAIGAAVSRVPGVSTVRDLVLDQLGIPPEVVDHLTFTATFASKQTQDALRGSGIVSPELGTYADVLWRYWAANLDPDRNRRHDPAGELVGRVVVITGASSGIGKATALKLADEGAVTILLARRADELDEVVQEVRAAGGESFAYPCDITDPDSVTSVVKEIIAAHDHVDVLVNNAGRSIRRSITLSTDRFHDFERTMAVNYFGAVRLVLELLPHMESRRTGHVVNVSSIGVQTHPPRFSAYVASKAALDAFSEVVASETWHDGITFTSVRMPLVRTPMIAPTSLYDAFPAATPDEAAAMLVRAIKDRPKRINTPVGTLGELMGTLAPKTKDAILHQAYRVFPDSASARGEKKVVSPVDADAPASSGGSLVPSAPGVKQASRAAVAFMRLLPGVHW
ncbi:SDR family oxidoreductase [Rhodococcus antarcticus]|uniref:SDR family oxidoreductase n=1 Tax=Rhodococcus antarcticus TaxID=2987751 RepID=A0ABY6NXU5_9NOCA|nr:SDR family oxidoreductase [Rhodococcus antarcticus]UZJ23846.1 SDR family oxidoreductase [Rhodococcus antarcticus]